MQTLVEWLKEISWLKNKPISELLELYFHRDPIVPTYVNPDVFLSPASGIIVYSKIVSPDSDIIPIKGERYTLKELLREDIKYPCIVIGIYMTPLDVHINKMPTDGFLSYKRLPAIRTNLYMAQVEIELFKKSTPSPNLLRYMIYNARTVNRIYYPKKNIFYYVVQVADLEVNVIAPFTEQNEFLLQGQRIGICRMGSQVDLVIPLLPHTNYSILGKELHHVEVGQDALVKIEF